MATIRKVAKHAGVSIGTVSKVLNGRDDKVAPAIKERILASIRELRYKPPALAATHQSLAHNIGLIVPDLTEQPLRRHSYIHMLLDGVLEGAAFRGYSVTVFAMTMWSEVGLAVRRKYDGRCDAVIVAAPQPNPVFVQSLILRGAPVLQVGTTAWLDDVSSIDIDNVAAGKMIAQHFLDLGHKRLGFVAIEHDQVSSRERYEGFRSVGGAAVTRFVMPHDETFAHFAHMYAQMGIDRPTALMCWHDGLAIPLIPALREVGLQVPEDVSVVGVDDSYLAEVNGVQLTTVPNPLREIGLMAAKMAIDRILDPSMPAEIIKLPQRLIDRGTTAPPREARRATKHLAGRR